MDPEELIPSACVRTGIAAADTDALLQTIAKIASDGRSELADDEVLARLQERERRISTAVGKGVAIPHCRLPGTCPFVLGLVTTASALPFAANDDQPVDLFAFVIGPEEATSAYLRLLASLANTLTDSNLVAALRADHDDTQARTRLVQAMRARLTPSVDTAMAQIQLLARGDDLHWELVQALSEESTAVIASLPCEDATSAIAHRPLFADFWSASQRQGLHQVLVTVPRSQIESLIQRLEQDFGPLAGRDDLLVMVRHLDRCLGSLL